MRFFEKVVDYGDARVAFIRAGLFESRSTLIHD